ncbi:MAG: DsbA family protein [Desulfamplus sp.]|nr:DsbA family protein [Desulfamplus sp.]
MTGSIEKLENEYDLKVKWRAFPLHPDTPQEGMTLEELFKRKGAIVNVDEIVTNLKATASKFGLAFGDRKMTYNSRLAQETGLWAATKNRGHQFHMEAFRAYFVEGKNISEKDVLLNMVERSGLDLTEGQHVIEARTFSDAVDAEWALSRAKGVTAVPTFFIELDRLVGAQSYETLKSIVEKYAGKAF